MLNCISAESSEKWRNEIEATIISRWMVDFIQEIYRLCIRNYNCIDPVEIHIYSAAVKSNGNNVDIYTKFYDAVESYFSVKNSKVICCEKETALIDLVRRKRKSAKGNKELATYGKLMNCLERMPKETSFTLCQLAQWSGVTYDAVKKEKFRNKIFAELLSEMETGNKIKNSIEYKKS